MQKKIKQKILDFAVQENICTRCFGEPSREGRRTCHECLEDKRRYKKNNRKRISDLQKVNYQKNKEHKKAVSAKYRAENPLRNMGKEQRAKLEKDDPIRYTVLLFQEQHSSSVNKQT